MVISVSANMCKCVALTKDNNPTYSQRRWIKRWRWSPLSLTSHEFFDSLLTWDPRYSTAQMKTTQSLHKLSPPTLPSSVPVFYRASWLHSGVQPLPSANHQQLRNNGLITETVTKLFWKECYTMVNILPVPTILRHAAGIKFEISSFYA